MHEFSLCQGLLAQIAAIAAQHQASSVKNILVRLGPLAGVEPQLLTQAFSVARAGTIAAQAELTIETLTVRVRCRTCGAETDATPNRLICGACGDWHTQLLSGDEMLLASVELVKPEE
jgi:hydrogenase nickel incorporation protein HypA/HybF